MIFLDTMKTCFRFHVTFIFQFPIYLEPFAPICEYIRYLYRFLGSKYVGNRKMKSLSRCKNASVQRRSLKRTWPRVAPNEGDALWLSSGRPRQHKTQGRSRIPATSWVHGIHILYTYCVYIYLLCKYLSYIKIFASLCMQCIYDYVYIHVYK